MKQKIARSVFLLVLLASALAIPRPVQAQSDLLCRVLNAMRKEESLKRPTFPASYEIPYGISNVVGWQGLVDLLSASFSAEEIAQAVEELNQLGKLDKSGADRGVYRFWDDDPEFCPPQGGKPADQPDPAPAPRTDPHEGEDWYSRFAWVLPWVVLFAGGGLVLLVMWFAGHLHGVPKRLEGEK